MCLPIDCSERGCNAHADVRVNTQTIIFDDLQCFMNIHVFQTDFDGDVSQFEGIEYLKINDEKAPFRQPTGNPCKSKYEGKALSTTDLKHALISNRSVTELIMNGGFSVDAKITGYVD